MGKRGKAARKRRRENEVISISTSTVTGVDDNERERIKTNEENITSDCEEHEHEISQAALNVTVATLHRLCGLVDIATGKLAIKNKRYRSLRKVLYELQICKAGSLLSSSSFVDTEPEQNHISSDSTISSHKITREISSQIENDAWELAVVSLRNLRRRQEQEAHAGQRGNTDEQSITHFLRPKLGSLQRWVRHIDAAGTNNPLALEVLDAILRAVAPEAIVLVDQTDIDNSTLAERGVCNSIIGGDSDERAKSGRIRLFPPFDCRQKYLDTRSPRGNQDEPEEEIDFIHSLVSCMKVGDDGIRRILSQKINPQHQSLFRRCGFEEGKNRKPPNHYNLVLVTTDAGSEVQEPAAPSDVGNNIAPYKPHMLLTNYWPVLKTPLPYIKKSFLLENVFSAKECDRLIALAELAGFHPDEPIGEQPSSSILAHACVWVVDHNMERTIFDRVKKFLPSFEQFSQDQSYGDVMETLQPLGLNRRFRFYRYVPGRYYRPHIDGAWPPSGFDSNGTYRYDVSDYSNKNGLHLVPREEVYDEGHRNRVLEQSTFEHNSRRQLSRLTFLIYLNDDFDGGHTTFFVPAAEKEGILNAFPITPLRGGVLVFPHGTIAGPLHEGSPVLKGAKYVIRTEVEYYV